MRVLALAVVVTASLCFLTACSTPTPFMPANQGGEAAASGGNASGKTTKADPQGAFSYMGAAVNARASSEDLVTGTNAGDGITIVNPGGVAPDPIVQSYVADIAALREQLQDAESAEERASIMEAMSGLRADLIAYRKDNPAKEPGEYHGTVENNVHVWKWGATNPDKLDAASIEKAAAAVKGTMDVAGNKTK